MKTKHLLLCLSILSTICIYSCHKKDEAPYINVDKTSLTELPAGQKDSILLTSNMNWTLSIPSSANWITADKTTGSMGSTKVIFTTLENTGNLPRSVEINIASSNNSQSIKVTVTQNATAQPVANFQQEAITQYAPAKIKFTNSSQNSSSYSWDFGNGKTSIKVDDSTIYSEPGTYTVTLTAKDGVKTNSKSVQITIVKDPGLIANYKLNGNVNDASGNGNNATNMGAVLTGIDRNGIPNSTAEFNGTNSYIKLPDSLIQNTNQTETISLWFKANNYSSPGILLGYYDKDYPNVPAYVVPSIYIGNNGNLYARYWPGTVNNWAPINISTIVSNNNGWIHLVMTRDENKQSVYLNGQWIRDLVRTTDFKNSKYNFLGVGYDNGWEGLNHNTFNFFKGSMDDVRIYKRALNEKEIISLFEEQ